MKTRNFILLFFLMMSLVYSSISLADGKHYLSGKIYHVTSTRDGLMIRLDTGVPENCQGSPNGLILIKKEDSIISTLALMAHQKGKSVTVYTDNIKFHSFCVANQVDAGHL